MNFKLSLIAAVLSVTANSASVDSIELDLGHSFRSPLSTTVTNTPSKLPVQLAPLLLLAAKDVGTEKVISIKGRYYNASIASPDSIDVLEMLSTLPRHSMGPGSRTIFYVDAILDAAARNYKIIKDGVTITLTPTL